MASALLPRIEPFEPGEYQPTVILKRKRRDGKVVRIRKPYKIRVHGRTIDWVKSPFDIKDDIKAMGGSKCHFTETNKFSHWSCSNTYRNRVQMEFLNDTNPLKWFYRPVEEFNLDDDFMPHQDLIANSVMTKHYQLIAGDPGVGKTLPIIRCMQAALANVPKADYPEMPIWWVGPANSMDAIEIEFEKWGFEWQHYVKMWSYDGLWRAVQNNKHLLDNPPFFLVPDEMHKLKTAETKRAAAGCGPVANAIRRDFWEKGFVTGLTGSPAPKDPCDWWSTCEIVWPGFLKEGSYKALQERLCHMEESRGPHGYFKKPTGWKEDQVKHLRVRLKGLVVVIRKQDTNMKLPGKIYEQVKIKPSKAIERAARSLAACAQSAATLWADLNMLSNGFQYVDGTDGLKRCPACNGTKVVTEYRDPDDPERNYKTRELLDDDFCNKLEEIEVECYGCDGKGEVPNTVRNVEMVPSPKDDALRRDLKEEEEHNGGRILISDAYRGSIDRVVNVCQAEDWTVIRCDGRGFRIMGRTGKPLPFWMNTEENKKVAFVIHPESGGTAFTLTEARKIVFYSNTARPDHREQAINRLHRPGQRHSVTIKDYMHLPSDYNMLELLIEKRRLELMTLSEFVTGMFA